MLEFRTGKWLTISFWSFNISLEIEFNFNYLSLWISSFSSPRQMQLVHRGLPLGVFSQKEIVLDLPVDPRVKHSDQSTVHSKVKSLQNKESRLHHPELHAQLGAAVVIQLVLVENNIVEKQYFLLDLELVVVNLEICGLSLKMVSAAS